MSAHNPPVTVVLDFNSLKEKQRALRSGFSDSLTLRVHRAISWFGRAQAEPDDLDVRFILLWIGFNAAYASDMAYTLSVSSTSLFGWKRSTQS